LRKLRSRTFIQECWVTEVGGSQQFDVSIGECMCINVIEENSFVLLNTSLLRERLVTQSCCRWGKVSLSPCLSSSFSCSPFLIFATTAGMRARSGYFLLCSRITYMSKFRKLDSYSVGYCCRCIDRRTFDTLKSCVKFSHDENKRMLSANKSVESCKTKIRVTIKFKAIVN